MPNPPGTELPPSEPDAASLPSSPLSPASRRTTRLVFATVLAAIGLWVARDFLVPLGWAVILTVALWPLYRRFVERVCPRRGSILPPLVFTLVTGLVLIVPLGFAAVELGREGQAVAQWLGRAQDTGIPEPDWLARVPVLGNRAAQWWREHLAQPQPAGGLLGNLDPPALANWTKALGAELLHRGFLFFVTMLALFFLFRDGEWLGRRLLDHADRVLGDPGERLAQRLLLAARGTFNGTVLVAISEGALIGIGYLVTGVPHAVLFAAITAAFAMLPFGAWFAFTAAALLLLSQGGAILVATLLFGWGAAVMMIGDNFIQPGLIGGSVRLPFLWALIGIFGGIHTFGFLGLFLGPVIMAGLMTIWRDWIDRPQLPEKK
jgi:predicted PurR-regulated permease PerM